MKFKSRYCALFYVLLISSNKFLSFLFLFLEPGGCVWVEVLEKNSMKTRAALYVLVICNRAITKFDVLRN